MKLRIENPAEPTVTLGLREYVNGRVTLVGFRNDVAHCLVEMYPNGDVWLFKSGCEAVGFNPREEPPF